MTTNIKTMKLALDALEHAARCVQTNYLPDQCGHDWDGTITALHQAISEAEQAEQEPVAYQYYPGAKFPHIRPFFRTVENRVKDLDLEDWIETPLYTAPPRCEWVSMTQDEIVSAIANTRIWVGLTDDEILKLVWEENSRVELVRAVIEKLKEKNNG